MQTYSGIHPHTVNGVDHLQEEDVRKYLIDSGYAGEAEALIAEANRFPAIYKYTQDRDHYLVSYIEFWLAGDCSASERRIKQLSAAFRASNSISPSR